MCQPLFQGALNAGTLQILWDECCDSQLSHEETAGLTACPKSHNMHILRSTFEPRQAGFYLRVLYCDLAALSQVRCGGAPRGVCLFPAGCGLGSASSVVAVPRLSRPTACRILVPRPGIKPMPPAVGAWSLNHRLPGKPKGGLSQSSLYLLQFLTQTLHRVGM